VARCMLGERAAHPMRGRRLASRAAGSRASRTRSPCSRPG
jgi:hypothetical protein